MQWDIIINLIFYWILEISSYEIDWKKPSRTDSIQNETKFDSFFFLFVISISFSFSASAAPTWSHTKLTQKIQGLCERMTKINYILLNSQIVSLFFCSCFFEMTSDWFLFIVHVRDVCIRNQQNGWVYIKICIYKSHSSTFMPCNSCCEYKREHDTKNK